jgi:hypothetical protein
MTYSKTDEKGRKSYKGYWLNNTRNGKGEMIFRDGKKQKGNFKDDIFID